MGEQSGYNGRCHYGGAANRGIDYRVIATQTQKIRSLSGRRTQQTAARGWAEFAPAPTIAKATTIKAITLKF